MNDRPRVHAALIVDRFAATGPRVVGISRGCHQEIELSLGHDLGRLDRIDVLAIVPRLGMVAAVRLDCDAPMVHRDQFHLEAEAGECAPRPGAGTAGAAEQVGDEHDADFCVRAFRGHLSPPADRSITGRLGSAFAGGCSR